MASVPPAPPGASGSARLGRRGRLGRLRPRPLSRADATAAAVTATVSVLLGVPAGLLWAATAPLIDVPGALDGAESAFRAAASADVGFGVIALGAGALCGGVAWWRAFRRGWTVPVALAAGGTGGALVAAALGHLRNSGHALAQVPPNLSLRAHDVVDFALRTRQAIVLWPVAALLVYVVLAVGLTDPEPRPEPVPAEPAETAEPSEPSGAAGSAETAETAEQVSSG